MKIELRERTEAHVRIYFERTRDGEIQRMCPQRAQTVGEALEDFKGTLLPGAGSFGRTVYADGKYVGDVWCFGIREEDEPDAMLSYCLFDRAVWGRGIGTEAVRLFLGEVQERFALRTVGAFTYTGNAASVRVLEKNGFSLRESFSEDGRQSGYYQRNMER